MKLLNEQALELFNIVNSLRPVKGSHQELAQTRTLRNMKAWSANHSEKLQDLRDLNCATKDVDGTKILLKKTLKRSVKNAKGEESTEEYQVNEYTPEGEAKLKKEIREYMRELVKQEFMFEIYSTYDHSGEISTYDMEVLKEYGFFVSKEEFDKKVEAKTKPTK